MDTHYRVIEDNGGGLHLYVYEDNRKVFAHSGYELTDHALIECLDALDGGDDTSDWDGNEPENYESDIASYYCFGWNIVCDNPHGERVYYPSRMGAAAALEFEGAIAHYIHGEICNCDDKTCTVEDEVFDWLHEGDLRGITMKDLIINARVAVYANRQCIAAHTRKDTA